MIKPRVQLGDYKGSIIATHIITVSGEDTEVHDVEWDDNPAAIPFKYKDEKGSDACGYLASDLVFL